MGSGSDAGHPVSRPLVRAARLAVPTLLAAGASAAGATPPPQFARSVDLARVSGTVTVSLPGHRAAPLHGPRRIPVGATVEAARGTARVTAADGRGHTYSGQFGHGSFQVLQGAGGGGTTEVKVLGTACAHSASSDGGLRAAAARRPRHHAPTFRQLQVDAAGGFVVLGRDASAVATGGSARYSLVDSCDGTRIVDERGHVRAKQKQAAARRLAPGESALTLCQPSSGRAAYCLLLIALPRSSTYSFGLALFDSAATSYGVCYRPPGGRTTCFTGQLAATGTKASELDCVVNDGPGSYIYHYVLAGRQLGPTLRFTATQPADPVLGTDSCTNHQLG